jgi:hypothetical protein
VVLQILSVVVPLLAAAIPLFRWPTLERRTRRHVALIKELPDGMGKRFRDAVEDELRELGHRSEQRLTRNVRALEFAVRTAIVLGLFTLSAVAYRRVTESDNVLITLGQGLWIALSMVVFIGLLSMLWKAAGSRYEMERLGRRAQDEGKSLILMNGAWQVLSDEEYEERKRRRNSGAANHEEAPPQAATGQLGDSGFTPQTNQPEPDGEAPGHPPLSDSERN